MKANNFIRDRISMRTVEVLCSIRMEWVPVYTISVREWVDSVGVCVWAFTVNFVAWTIYIYVKWSELMSFDRGCVDDQHLN